MRPAARTIASIVLAAALSACAGSGEAPTIAASTMPPWRDLATQDDRGRIRDWRTAWVRALAQARGAGHGAEVAREGVLLDPDAAIAWQNPPEGDYACRIVKLGAKSSGMLDYVSYPAFNCRIRSEGSMTSFAKLTGSQRPVGLLLPTQEPRMVFLGTLQLGDERSSLQYGRDRERDMAGIVERIGERRWRLFFPYPHFESTLDVLELIPKDAASRGPR